MGSTLFKEFRSLALCTRIPWDTREPSIVSMPFSFSLLLHRAEGYPPPDTYYVDQVKNTLHQMEALDIPSVCESR